MSELSDDARTGAEQIEALCDGTQEKMATHEKKKAALLSTFDNIRAIVDRGEKLALSMDEEAGWTLTSLSKIKHRSQEIRGIRVPQSASPFGFGKAPTALGAIALVVVIFGMRAAPAHSTHQEYPMSVRDVLIGQADGLATIGEHEKATRIYRRCLSTDGPVETIASRAEVRVKMADCYLHTKQYQVAISLCDEVIAKIPKKTSPINKRAHTIGGLAMLALAGDDGPQKQKALDVLFFGDEFGRRVYDKLTGAKK